VYANWNSEKKYGINKLEKEEEKMREKFLFFVLIISVSLLICGNFAFSQDNDRITGYYYDPQTGTIIPRYGNLSPQQSLRQGELKKAKIKEKTYSYPHWKCRIKSYINEKGQILRRDIDYEYSYSWPKYQWSYKAKASYVVDYYYYPNGRRKSYVGSGIYKGEWSFRKWHYSFDYYFNYARNYHEDGRPSYGYYQYFDNKTQNPVFTWNYKYDYYENRKRKSVYWKGVSYNRKTGEKRYIYEYTVYYDRNGRWKGYHYVLKDGKGKVIYERKYFRR